MYASHASHAYIVKILCAQAVPPRRANERAAALPVRRVAHARWSRKTELQMLAAARRRLLAGVDPRVENVVLVAPQLATSAAWDARLRVGLELLFALRRNALVNQTRAAAHVAPLRLQKSYIARLSTTRPVFAPARSLLHQKKQRSSLLHGRRGSVPSGSGASDDGGGDAAAAASAAVAAAAAAALLEIRCEEGGRSVHYLVSCANEEERDMLVREFVGTRLM